MLKVESELARLTQSTYPPAQLLQRPLPVGVDPTRLELYLSQQHFQVSVLFYILSTFTCSFSLQTFNMYVLLFASTL